MRSSSGQDLQSPIIGPPCARLPGWDLGKFEKLVAPLPRDANEMLCLTAPFRAELFGVIQDPSEKPRAKEWRKQKGMYAARRLLLLAAAHDESRSERARVWAITTARLLHTAFTASE